MAEKSLEDKQFEKRRDEILERQKAKLTKKFTAVDETGLRKSSQGKVQTMIVAVEKARKAGQISDDLANIMIKTINEHADNKFKLQREFTPIVHEMKDEVGRAKAVEFTKLLHTITDDPYYTGIDLEIGFIPKTIEAGKELFRRLTDPTKGREAGEDYATEEEARQARESKEAELR